MDKIDKIIAYESGDLGETETVHLFAELIETGECWKLQGHYGRTADALINHNVINEDGKIIDSRYVRN